MILSGFLAPDGYYTECVRWSHLSTAERIAHEVYEQKAFEGLQAEEYLLDQGYVIFYMDGVQHRFQVKVCDVVKPLPLTSQQKDFMVKNLSRANNFRQRMEMENLLHYDMECQENGILSRMEERLFMYQT